MHPAFTRIDVQSKALRHDRIEREVGEHWDWLSNTHQHSCEQHTLLVCSFHQRWLTTWVREKNRRHTESLSPWSVKAESKKYLQRRRTEWQAKLSRKWNTRILPQSITNVVVQSKLSKGKNVNSNIHASPHIITCATSQHQHNTWRLKDLVEVINWHGNLYHPHHKLQSQLHCQRRLMLAVSQTMKSIDNWEFIIR